MQPKVSVTPFATQKSRYRLLLILALGRANTIRQNSEGLSMTIGIRQIFCLLLACSFALAACASNPTREQVEGPRTSSSNQALENRFVARLISIEPGKRAEFIAHLGDCYLPVWNRLRDKGVLTTVSVFELNHYNSTTKNTSARDYLVLAQLGSQVKPEDLMDAEKASASLGSQDLLTFSVLRTAFMSCTPNSCHGMPEPAYQDALCGIDFLIEFIGVEETPAALAKYREIVSKYAGPANGILVDRGMLHCFVALENIEVLYDTHGAVPWNQIHISDDWDVGGEVDWHSIYEEIFRSEFSCDLDSVWAELPPTDKTRADYHGRLIPKLCVR